MANPSDTSPLFEAVKRALTKWTGQPRAVPRSNLFLYGRPADMLKAPRPGEVFRRPRCFLNIVDRPIDPFMQMTDRRRVEATISIWCWYYGHEIHGAEWEAAMTRARADVQHVSQALTYPGALYLDHLGRSTGLDGYSLREDGDRHRIEGPRPRANTPRIIEVAHTFRAECELTSAT